MKEFKETLIRHSSNANKDRVKRMAELLRSFCIYCLVADIYPDNERIFHINTILPILCKFENFSENESYLAQKASDLEGKAIQSASADPIGFKFALALKNMVSIFKQGGNDRNVLLECIFTTIALLSAKRDLLQKTESTINNHVQSDTSKRRKTDLQDIEENVFNDKSGIDGNDQPRLETTPFRIV